MKKYIYLSLFCFLLLSFSIKTTAQPSNFDFYVENGTCKCPDAAVGDSGTVSIDGQQLTFTKRTRSDIENLLAAGIFDNLVALTCTTGITNMSELFENYGNFNENINYWDVSQVTNMYEMFRGATSFNQPLNNWDVSKVTDMRRMFFKGFNNSSDMAFNQPLNNWDVSQVTSMTYMFNGAASFNQPLNNWDVSQVTSMGGMFRDAASFNQPLNNWDVSQVTSMGGMFRDAASFNQPLNNWDVSQVTAMNYMFYYATSFNKDLSNWCVEKISSEPSLFSGGTNMSTAFQPDWGAQCLSTWDGSSWNGGIPGKGSIATIDADYDVTDRLDCKVLTVNPNKTINVYGVLNAVNAIQNDGEIVFKSDANGTGQLDSFDGVLLGSGDYTAERYIPVLTEGTRAFRFLTSSINSTGSIYENWQENGNSPAGLGTHITGSTAGANGLDASITGNPSMYTFDNTFVGDQSNAWNPVLNTQNNTIEAGKAYRMFIRGDRNYDLDSFPADSPNANVTLSATGDIETGDVTFNLSQNGNYYNLIGNPYQAAVDVSSIHTYHSSQNPDNSNRVNENFYWVWDPNMGQKGAYVAVDLSNGGTTTGSSEANQFIQPGQSFFVQNRSFGSSHSIKFTEFDKAVNETQTTVFSEDFNPSIKLLLYKQADFNNNDTEVDALGIHFKIDGDNMVTEKDAMKLGNPDENLARLNGSTYLSIENRAMPNKNSSLPLYLAGYTTDNYTFSVEKAYLPDDIDVFLKDHYTGNQTLVQDGNNIVNFSVDSSIPKSVATDRFSIDFDVETFSISDNESIAQLNVYPNPVTNGNLTIESNSLAGQSVNVSLYNMLGQLVLNSDTDVSSNGKMPLEVSEQSSGIYFLEINSEKGTFKEKIIIK